MIFQCVDKKLTNTQLIHGDGHGRGAGVILSDGGKKMIMNSVYDYTPGHCCPRYLETAVFKFARGEYDLVATHQKENHYPLWSAKTTVDKSLFHSQSGCECNRCGC